jgi:hypothetical protein
MRTTLELAERVALRLNDQPVKREEKADQLIAKDPEGFHRALEADGGAVGRAARRGLATRKARGRAPCPGRVTGHGRWQDLSANSRGSGSGTVSEPVNDLLWAVGKKRSLDRLNKALG